MSKILSPKDQKMKNRLEKALSNGDVTMFSRGRKLFTLLPSDPRCTSCHAPFEGTGGRLVSNILNIKRSTLNPLMCNRCEEMIRHLKYGSEVEMSMLFADIRGSTPLAESMSPTEFKELIDRFYNETTHVLTHSYAIIDKLVGDEVSGYYLPSNVGKDYVDISIQAARDILRVTGHDDPQGPWVPVGVGIHAGIAYLGAVSSSDGLVELTALGDAVNTASRLATKAATGEIVISDHAAQKAQIDTSSLEKRSLDLKGKRELMDVWVVGAA